MLVSNCNLKFNALGSELSLVHVSEIAVLVYGKYYQCESGCYVVCMRAWAYQAPGPTQCHVYRHRPVDRPVM